MICELPVSEAQTAILADCERYGAVHQITALLEVTGLDDGAGAARLFLDTMSAAHPLLHSTFHATAKGFRRRIDKPADVTPILHVVDASALSEAILRERMAEESARRFQLDRESGVRAIWWALGPRKGVFQITLNHVVYDHVIATELCAASVKFFLGLPPHSLPPSDHRVFVEQEMSYLASIRAVEDQKALESRLGGRSLRMPLPEGKNGVQFESGAAIPLLPDNDRNIYTTFSTLLAAWWLTLTEWLDRDDLLLGTTVNLRRNRAAMDTFGPVFQYAPIVVDAGRNTAPETATQEASKALKAAIRTARMPSRLVSVSGNPCLGFNANINFYDFDRFEEDHPVKWTRISGGRKEGSVSIREVFLRDVPLVRPYDLNLAISKLGGRLRASLRFRPDLLSKSESEHLLTRLAMLHERTSAR